MLYNIKAILTLISRYAGSSFTTKFARVPNTFGSDQCCPCNNDFPRASILHCDL